MKKILTIICILSVVFNTDLLGQKTSEKETKKGSLSGVIINDESNQGLEFATISVYDKEESSLVAGGISKTKGKFKISVPYGTFNIKVEFIGFTPSLIENIVVNKDKPNIDLGTISIASSGTDLTEVEVRAEKSTVQLTLDKKVFNVGKDLLVGGGNATDVLDNVPSVTVDIDGNVNLRGNPNVNILIDGKPSQLKGANFLQSLPANMIDKVEVITNPSASYDAEGLTGIINIVLKKQKGKGLKGSFDLDLGIPTLVGVGANLSYRKNKINLFANYGLSFRKYQATGYSEDTFFFEDELPSSFTNRRIEMDLGGLTNNFKFGSDFYLNEKNILNASITLQTIRSSNSRSNFYEDFDSYKEKISNELRTDEEEEKGYTFENSLSYKKLFDKKDQNLSVILSWSDYTGDENSDINEQLTDDKRNPIADPSVFQSSNNKESNRTFLFQSDYIHPISKKGKVEFGLKTTFREIKNDYEVAELDGAVWKTIENFSNEFIYDEKIYAAYGKLSNKIGKFGYQLGLRSELTDLKTELIETNEINDREPFLNFFPSVHLTYDLPKSNSIQLSYSRRIGRAYFEHLNPFIHLVDDRNIRRGNPNLNPMYTNSFEISHIKNWDKTTLSSAVYYLRTKDVVNKLSQYDFENNFVTSIPYNLAERDAYGLEFSISTKIKKWWRLNASADFFRQITNGYAIDSDFSADTYTWTGRVMNKMTIWNNIIMQTTFSYRAPKLNTQGKVKSISVLSIGFSKDILKDKGTVTFKINDLFNSRVNRFEKFIPNRSTIGEVQRRPRSFIVEFNYRLNQKKKRRGRR